MIPIKERCKENVYNNSYRPTTCSRRNVRDGYCKQHHPETKAAKDKKWQEKYDKDKEATQRKISALTKMQQAQGKLDKIAEIIDENEFEFELDNYTIDKIYKLAKGEK